MFNNLKLNSGESISLFLPELAVMRSFSQLLMTVQPVVVHSKFQTLLMSRWVNVCVRRRLHVQLYMIGFEGQIIFMQVKLCWPEYDGFLSRTCDLFGCVW